MTAIVVTAHFTPASGRRDALLDALREFIPRVHREQGCEFFALHEDLDGNLLAVEKWASEADLGAHDRGAPVADFRARLDGLVSSPPVVVRHRSIPIGDSAKGIL